jgi:hypothetical protein
MDKWIICSFVAAAMTLLTVIVCGAAGTVWMDSAVISDVMAVVMYVVIAIGGVMSGTLAVCHLVAVTRSGRSRIAAAVRCFAVLAIFAFVFPVMIVFYFLNWKTRPSWDIYDAVMRSRTDEIIEMARRNPDVVNATSRLDTSSSGPGYTPLCIAPNESVARILVSLGANVNKGADGDYTPLHCACSGHRTAVARYLIEAGADVNALDENGQTPLHFAVKNARIENVRLLLDNAARCNIKDITGETPIDIANSSAQSAPNSVERADILRLLESQSHGE